MPEYDPFTNNAVEAAPSTAAPKSKGGPAQVATVSATTGIGGQEPDWVSHLACDAHTHARLKYQRATHNSSAVGMGRFFAPGGGKRARGGGLHHCPKLFPFPFPLPLPLPCSLLSVLTQPRCHWAHSPPAQAQPAEAVPAKSKKENKKKAKVTKEEKKRQAEYEANQAAAANPQQKVRGHLNTSTPHCASHRAVLPIARPAVLQNGSFSERKPSLSPLSPPDLVDKALPNEDVPPHTSLTAHRKPPSLPSSSRASIITHRRTPTFGRRIGRLSRRAATGRCTVYR